MHRHVCIIFSDVRTFLPILEKTGPILTSNQLEFDEGFSPYCKEELIATLGEMDDEIDIVYKASAPIQWIDYDQSLPLGTFKKVDMGSARHLILQSPSDPNTYLKVDQETFFTNLLALALCVRRL